MDDACPEAMSALVCASHSPLLHCFEKEPADWGEMQALFDRYRRAVERFDPELIVVFGADHFNGFFLANMPAFCVGLRATAEEDIGGHSGPLSVPEGVAVDLVSFVRDRGVDPGVSYRMTVDHAFSQTLHLLTGDLSRYPTIPIFVSCITRPFIPFSRARALGEAVGEFVASLGTRTLLVASGGMSHHPARYYPDPADADTPVAEWEITGGASEEALGRDDWLRRLDQMHREGAAMIARGERTAADMRINPERDQELLGLLSGFELEAVDGWDLEELVGEAGIGSTELLTWVAATAAHRRAGGAAPEVGLYSVAPEIGIGFGAIQALPS